MYRPLFHLCQKVLGFANLSATRHLIAKFTNCMTDFIRSVKTLNGRVYDPKCRSIIIVNLLISTPIYLITVCIKAICSWYSHDQASQSKELLAHQWLPIKKD